MGGRERERWTKIKSLISVGSERLPGSKEKNDWCGYYCTMPLSNEPVIFIVYLGGSYLGTLKSDTGRGWLYTAF